MKSKIKKIYPRSKLLTLVSKFFFSRGQLESLYLKSFFKNINLSNTSPKQILIYSGIGRMYLTPIETLTYHLLKNKNYEVDYFIYDESIPINEVITKDRIEKQGKKKFWSKSVKQAKKFLNAANVNYQFIQIDKRVYQIIDKIPQNDLQFFLNFTYENIDFGSIVEGVMYRYYKSSMFGEDAVEIARQFLITALSNYFQIKKLTQQKKYDYLFFSHGIYCTWQPIVKYCEKQGIQYVCYDRAKTKGHCNFNLNLPSPIWDISKAWSRLENYSLSLDEENRVDRYLKERILQKGDVYSYNFSDRVDNISQLKKKLGINENKKIITFFTNLIWDAANVSRDIAFESPLQCIIETINKYKEFPNLHFFIRTHPAEKVLGTKERYEGLVMDVFNHGLPDNVTILSPDKNINSFDVLELSDIGVVHTSTVGLEMAIENKPVILISETHYRGKGFTYDAESKVHYFELLNQLVIKPQVLPHQKDLARKYFYLMMFEYQHAMPMSFTDTGQFNGYGYASFQEMKTDESLAINRIIDRINSSQPFDDFVFR